MSKVVIFENVTLDGVMQAPGREDEDTRGGFEHGGWAVPYADSVLGEAASASMANTGGLLLGRLTYEDILAYWNETDSPFKDILNNTQKYVASKRLEEPLAWPNSALLKGDAVKAVADLRKKSGKDLVVLGSGKLAASLRQADLVDQYVLMIHPLVLGSGRRLFDGDGPVAKLQLVDTKATTTGVVIATYQRAD
jgi:dihydrofolate reductase